MLFRMPVLFLVLSRLYRLFL